MNTQELILVPVNRKGQIEVAVSELTAKIDSGEVNPLQVLANIKSYEKVFDKVKEVVITASLKEADKYADKEISEYGVKFEKMEAGVSYDYKQCGHSKYNEICNQIEELTVKKKEYEKLLQAIKQVTPIADTESGEMMDVYPPLKRSTTTIKVTIK